MPATTGATATSEGEWCILRAEGLSYSEIARRHGSVGEKTVRVALQKPANAAFIRRAIREIREAAILAARHNIAASVSEKCRLRLAVAKNLGIEEGGTPRLGLDSSAYIRDYLSVDKAINEQLRDFLAEDTSERVQDRLDNVEERAGEIHSLDVRRGKILLKMTEAEIDGNSAAHGESPADSDETLPSNSRAY